MSIPRIFRLLLGCVFLIAGLCLPFAARSLSSDWNPQLSPIQNARQSHVPLLPDTRKPRFKAVPKGRENPSAYVVQFEETQLFMEFDHSVTTTEMQKAIQEHFPNRHIPLEDPVTGHIRFEGWSGHSAVSAPFAWVMALSLVLLLGGAWLASAARALQDKPRA